MKSLLRISVACQVYSKRVFAQLFFFLQSDTIEGITEGKKKSSCQKHCLVQMVEEAEAAARCDGRPGAATKNSSISSLPHKIKNTKDLT